jgi:hypothetical protein
MTLGIMTFSTMTLNVDAQQYRTQHSGSVVMLSAGDAECLLYWVSQKTLSVILLNVVMLIAITRTVVMLCVIMLSVVSPAMFAYFA